MSNFKISFVVALYALCGCLWTYLPGKVLGEFISNSSLLSYDMETVKGFIFIFLTSFLLYLFINRLTRKNREDRRQAEQGLRSYARHLIEMDEKLRNEFASKLHDEIGRDLTAAGMNLAIINYSLTEETSRDITEKIQHSRSLIENISRNIRDIMSNLRPPVLDDFGMPAVLRWYSNSFSSRTGMEALVLADEPFPRLSVETETSLFRIAQEALNNVAKHAGTQIVTIKLQNSDGMIRLLVIDEGQGFIAACSSDASGGPGWGIKIMNERTKMIGGSFKLESAPGKGTVVSVNLPLEKV